MQTKHRIRCTFRSKSNESASQKYDGKTYAGECTLVGYPFVDSFKILEVVTRSNGNPLIRIELTTTEFDIGNKQNTSVTKADVVAVIDQDQRNRLSFALASINVETVE